MAEPTLDITLAGDTLRLCADRALYWPARRRLLVADVHLGKGDTFRAAGIALPSGGTRHDLHRLTGLIEQTHAESLWVLGDLLHGPRIDSSWRAHWSAFCARHRGMDLRLIEGNHDRAAARAQLGIAQHADGLEDGPFIFTHTPLSTPPADGRFGICGHLHPVAGVPGFRGRFPAFVLAGQQLVLPAFSAFTGGVSVPGAQARYACLRGHVLDLNPTA